MSKSNLIMDILDKVERRSDLDWAEIVEMHGLDMHPDTLRKASVGIKLAANCGMLSLDGAPVQRDDYREEYKAKKQFYDQRREFNRILAGEARADHLAECLVESAKKLNETKPLKKTPYVTQSWLRREEEMTEAALVLTDWHYGMTADNVWNKYNIDTCRRRIETLIEKVHDKIRLHGVDILHVFILGDMVNGAVHVSSRVASEETVVDQLMQVSELLAETISALAEDVERVKVYCTYGNHARTVANKKDSIHVDNMERIIPWWLEQRFSERNDIVVMDAAKYELLSANIAGHEVCAVHGDLDTGKDSVLLLSQLYEKAYGKKMEYLITGHMHSMLDTEQLGIESIRSGSLCGTDEFAKNARLFSEPRQTMLIFSRDDGVDDICHIRVA